MIAQDLNSVDIKTLNPRFPRFFFKLSSCSNLRVPDLSEFFGTFVEENMTIQMNFLGLASATVLISSNFRKDRDKPTVTQSSRVSAWRVSRVDVFNPLSLLLCPGYARWRSTSRTASRYCRCRAKVRPLLESTLVRNHETRIVHPAVRRSCSYR